MKSMTRLLIAMKAIDKRWLVGYVFLLFVGFSISLKQPPFYMPDEGAHYLRAHEVSRLHLINFRGNVGADVSCSEYITAAKKYHLTPNVQKKAEDGQADPLCTVRSRNTAGSYSFIPYIPAAAALALTDTLGWAVEQKLAAARSLNFLVWFSILFAGLMFICKGRLLILCIVLMPAFFWQLVALSADGASLASCVVFVCAVVGLIQRGQAVSGRAIGWLVALAMLIGASKGVYALIALFALALWDQLPGKSWWFKVASLASPTVAALGIFLLFTGMADPSQVYLGNGAVPAEQLNYVIQNPLAFSKTLLDMFLSTPLEAVAVPRYAVANPRSSLNAAIIFGLALAVLMLRSDFGAGRRGRFLAAALSVAGFIGFCLPLYLTYTPVGASSILGIQGRYYLPLLPLVFVALAINMSDVNWPAFQSKAGWIIVLPILFLLWACWNIK